MTEELQKQVKIYYRTGEAYRASSLYLIEEVDKLLNAKGTGHLATLVKQAHQSLAGSNLNARERRSGSSNLPENLAARYADSLARFRGAFSEYLVRAASAANGVPEEAFYTQCRRRHRDGGQP